MTAQITCLVALAVPLGGTASLTLMSTIFNNKSGQGHQDARTGITYAFVSLIPVMWLCLLLTTFMANAWILQGGHEVVRGAYPSSFVTRKKLEREHRSRETGRQAVGTSAPRIDLEALGERELPESNRGG